MDQQGEQDTKLKVQIDALSRKIAIAAKARFHTEADMMSRDSFSPDEAVRLAVAWRSYANEGYLYDGDLAELEFWFKENDRLLNKDIRRENEVALTQAATGDYRALKGIIAGYASSSTANSRILRTRVEIERKSSQYKKLLDAVPDHGDPVTLPIPSWMDSRFNKTEESVI